MNSPHPTFRETVVKSVAAHTVTYFIMGLLTSTLLNYAQFYSQSRLSGYMRPTSDPWVVAGPLFQPIWGLLFGIVFYLLREMFFGRTRGWLVISPFPLTASVLLGQPSPAKLAWLGDGDRIRDGDGPADPRLAGQAASLSQSTQGNGQGRWPKPVMTTPADQ